jgi:hypothetical protein
MKTFFLCLFFATIATYSFSQRPDTTGIIWNPSKAIDSFSYDSTIHKSFLLCNSPSDSSYVFGANGKISILSTNKDLYSAIEINKNEIQKSTLFLIVIDSSSEKANLNDMRDRLRGFGITNYQLISPMDYMNSFEFHSASNSNSDLIKENLLENDSETLSIHMLKYGYQVSLLKETKLLKNSIELNTFICSHICSINQNKILIFSPINRNSNKKHPIDSMPKQIKPIISVLKQNNIFKFRLSLNNLTPLKQ